MSLVDFVQHNKSLIEAKLRSLLDEKISIEKDKLVQQALQDLLNFSIQGKMLRGNFVLLAHEIYGGENQEAALHMAAALELNQAGLLIHDDIMDNDEIRRGEKAMFVKYRDVGQQRKAVRVEAYGTSMAIVIGDTAFFLSYEILCQLFHLNVSSEIISQVFEKYSEEMGTVSAGQMADHDLGQTDYIPSEDEILHMYHKKTGGYTFVLPLTLGAVLAEANSQKLKGLREFGEALGTLFQIKDDEIGLFGDEKQTGKPVGSDIRENKKTLIRVLLYKKVTDDERSFLDGLFGNENIDANNIEKLQSLAQKYEIGKHIHTYVEKYADTARKAIPGLSIDEKYQDTLQELIEYSINRGK